MHVLLVEGGGEDFDVSTATVNVLLVLYSELNDCLLALVGELVELGGHGVELGILAGLDALVLLGIAVELAVAQHELAKVVFVLGVHPPALPVCPNKGCVVFKSKYLEYGLGLMSPCT